MNVRAQMGGIKAHNGKGLDHSNIGELETVRDAQRWLRTIAEGVVTGKLRPQEGSRTIGASGSRSSSDPLVRSVARPWR